MAKGKTVISRDGYWGPTYGYLLSGSLNIPETVTNNGVTYKVTEVGHLEKTNLTTVKIPNTVTRIRYNAFFKCKELTSVSLPNSLKTIEEGAFNGCTKLSSIKLPENLEELGRYNPFDILLDNPGIFAESGISSIIIPSNVKDMAFCAFYRCNNLTYAELKEGATCLANYAFFMCHRLRTVKLPISLLTYLKECYSDIGTKYDPFCDCPSLEKIIIPASTYQQFAEYLPKYKHLLVEE